MEETYVKIRKTNFVLDNKSKLMLQISDVSYSIMYSLQKAENQFLSMSNACVSHELRNPLNSIMAKNIEKEVLYSQLADILKDLRSKVRQT